MGGWSRGGWHGPGHPLQNRKSLMPPPPNTPQQFWQEGRTLVALSPAWPRREVLPGSPGRMRVV